MEDLILETGNQMLFELGIHGVRPELASLLGRLKYRMTCGQNALHHSREVAELAGLMAEELEIIESQVGKDRFLSGKFPHASSLFSDMIKEEDFDEFLTIPAYNQL